MGGKHSTAYLIFLIKSKIYSVLTLKTWKIVWNSFLLGIRKEMSPFDVLQREERTVPWAWWGLKRSSSSLTYVFPPGRFLGLHLLHWLISVSLVGLLGHQFAGLLAPPGADWPLENLRIGDAALLRGPHLRPLRGVVQRVGSELVLRVWRGAAPLWVEEWAGGLQRSGWRWRRAAGLIFISVALQSPWSSALALLSLLWQLRPFWMKTSELSLVPVCGSSRTLWSFRTNLGHVCMWRKRWVQQWFE